MNGLYLMVTITDRNMARRFIALYESEGVSVSFTALGSGTAINETLDYFGLARSQKAVMLSTVTHDVWQAVKARLQSELKIDIPGIGIAFIIPLSSIGGKKQLFFLTDGQKFEKGEESELKNTKYELLLAITNQGHTDTVMDAAREAKASGGTVIHAKGTGTERAEKFLGVSIAAEKEIIFIVVRTEQKNAIMQAIMSKAGTDTEARTIVFSLPVTSTAGIRLIEGTRSVFGRSLWTKNRRSRSTAFFRAATTPHMKSRYGRPKKNASDIINYAPMTAKRSTRSLRSFSAAWARTRLSHRRSGAITAITSAWGIIFIQTTAW